MSGWVKKNSVLNETAACFGVPLSSQQMTLVSNILGAMEERIPSHVWRDTPVDLLSSFHLRNLINVGVIPPDSLNSKGWDALQSANAAVEDAKLTLGNEVST